MKLCFLLLPNFFHKKLIFIICWNFLKCLHIKVQALMNLMCWCRKQKHISNNCSITVFSTCIFAAEKYSIVYTASYYSFLCVCAVVQQRIIVYTVVQYRIVPHYYTQTVVFSESFHADIWKHDYDNSKMAAFINRIYTFNNFFSLRSSRVILRIMKIRLFTF